MRRQTDLVALKGGKNQRKTERFYVVVRGLLKIQATKIETT